MAEVLLLLIFCLLLFLKLINDRMEEAEKKRDELKDKNVELEKSVSDLQEDLTVLESYLATTEPQSNQSDFVQQISQSASLLEVFDPEKTSELTTLLKEDPRALEKIKIATDDQWAELTTKTQFYVSEELYQTLSALNEEQVQNLMSNADIAANTPPSALQDMTSKPAPPTPDESYRDELAAQVTIDELEKLAAGRMTEEGNNWPPIISLPDAENFSFEVGSAKLTDGFKVQLRSNIADQILETLQQYDADVIEVIGHTDLQRMRQEIRTTNLDAEALRFFTSDNDFTLRAKDNAGLGYARALSVTKQLKNIPELSDYTILPYSGAQLISPDETINLNPDQFDSSQLRRIEIRVRRKNSSTTD
ncbi:MAG: hypothetical protein P8N95_00375 [Paracoccaceae bacterium]|nr:hypothetical protein [Paracoccaceae bacterium]